MKINSQLDRVVRVDSRLKQSLSLGSGPGITGIRHKPILTSTGNIRNGPCKCGSGKKYKKCCLPRDEKNQRELLRNPDLIMKM